MQSEGGVEQRKHTLPTINDEELKKEVKQMKKTEKSIIKKQIRKAVVIGMSTMMASAMFLSAQNYAFSPSGKNAIEILKVAENGTDLKENGDCPLASIVSFYYSIKDSGKVSAAVYDSDGELVRELIQGEEQNAGEHVLHWDGIDQLGRPSPPGEYEWRVLRTPGFQSAFISMIGTTPTSTPYSVWPGNFNGITAIAVDDTGVYLGSQCPENTPSIIKQSHDGSEHFWSHARLEAWQGPIALASDSERVYFLQSNSKLWLLGVHVSDRGEYENEIRSSEIFGSFDVASDGSAPQDMDAAAECIALSYPDRDMIRWLDVQSGDERGRAEVPSPSAIALNADATTYVASEGQILRFSKDSEIAELFINSDMITNPVKLAYDRWCDELLVVEGEPAHQVKRFDAGGKLLNTYGNNGGRAWGKHKPKDFRDIVSIAAAPDGSFILSEDAIRRTVHISKSGEVINEWLGAQDFYNFASIDPGDPSRVFYLDGNNATSVVKIDEQNNTSHLAASYYHPRNGIGGGLFPASTHYHSQWRARRRGGELYLINDSRNAGGPAIVRVDEQEGILVPVAAANDVGYHSWHNGKNAPGKPDVLVEAMKYKGLDPDSRSGSFFWSDTNRNDRIDPEEFIFFERKIGGGRYIHIDDDWNVLLASGNFEDGGSAWYTLHNEAPLDSFVPHWNVDEVEPSAARWPSEYFKHLGSVELRSISRDKQGNTYIAFPANRNTRDDRHGSKWPTGRSGSHRIAVWAADESFTGMIGRHAIAHPRNTPPTHFHDLVYIIGHVKDNAVVSDRVGIPARVFTSDGLYAGSFFDRRADDGFPLHVYAWFRDKETNHPDTLIPYDILSGGSVVVVGDDEVLWTHQGENASPLYRVSGWKGWERYSGKIDIERLAKHARGEGTGVRGEVFDNQDFAGDGVCMETPRLWCVANKRINPGSERGASDWSEGPVEGISNEDSFSVRWRGELEAPLTEAYRFSVYNRHPHTATASYRWDNEHGRTRVRLGGVLVIDTESRVPVSRPIQLDAGRRYAIEIEYIHYGKAEAEYHLNWESTTQERQRIPTEYLYAITNKSVTDMDGDLALSIDNTRLRPGESTVVTLTASSPPKDDMWVRIGTEGSTAESFTENLPNWLKIPEGKTQVSFTVKTMDTIDFARLFCAVEPTMGWKIPHDVASVEMIASSQTDLFSIPEKERVVLADDFKDSSLWRSGLTSRFENDKFGPLIESNGVGFSADRDLPLRLDVRLQPVVLYMRVRSLGKGWGARAGLDFTKGNNLGVYVSLDGITMNGNAIPSGHGASGIYRFNNQTRPDPDEFCDVRVEFRMIDGLLTGIASLKDEDGEWVEVGRQDTTRHDTPFQIPDRLGELHVRGANNPGAYFDAVAVTVGEPYK